MHNILAISKRLVNISRIYITRFSSSVYCSLGPEELALLVEIFTVIKCNCSLALRKTCGTVIYGSESGSTRNGGLGWVRHISYLNNSAPFVLLSSGSAKGGSLYQFPWKVKHILPKISPQNHPKYQNLEKLGALNIRKRTNFGIKIFRLYTRFKSLSIP